MKEVGIAPGFALYCNGCGWSYVPDLTATATTICPKCFGSSFSTEKPQSAVEEK